MTRTRFLVLALVLAAGSLRAADSLSAPAADPASYRFEVAARLYDRGAYDSAAALYQGLLAEGYTGFAVEYNLGNALYKAGRLGPAILHYERAARIDPDHADLRHNLELAYLRQPDAAVEPLPETVFQRFWGGLTGLLPERSWAWTALAAAWLALGGLVLVWFRTDPAARRRGAFATLAAGLVALASAGLGASAHRTAAAERHAIVLAPSVVLKSAPVDQATNLYILREGFKLRLLDETGGWWQLALPDGNVGWAPAEDLAEV
jgi:hypothetical protein